MLTQFDTLVQTKFTYSGLARNIRRCASVLSNKYSVRADQYVVFIGRASFEYLALYFGCISIGAIPVHLPTHGPRKFDIRKTGAGLNKLESSLSFFPFSLQNGFKRA